MCMCCSPAVSCHSRGKQFKNTLTLHHPATIHHTHTHTHTHAPTRAHTSRDVRIGRSRGSPAFRFCLAWRISSILQRGKRRSPAPTSLEEGSGNRTRCFLCPCLSLPVAARTAQREGESSGETGCPPQGLLLKHKATLWSSSEREREREREREGERGTCHYETPSLHCACRWQPRAPRCLCCSARSFMFYRKAPNTPNNEQSGVFFLLLQVSSVGTNWLWRESIEKDGASLSCAESAFYSFA